MWQALIGGAQIAQGYMAGKDARSAGKTTSRNIMRQAEEEIRRLEIQQDFNMGTNIANLGGSGITETSGTASSNLTELATENIRQVRWAKESAKMAAREARAGGQAAWYQSTLGGVTAAANTWSNNI